MDDLLDVVMDVIHAEPFLEEEEPFLGFYLPEPT